MILAATRLHQDGQSQLQVQTMHIQTLHCEECSLFKGPLTKKLFKNHRIIQMLTKNFTGSVDLCSDWVIVSEIKYFLKYGFA